jgi:hypothetical protein
MPAVLSVDLACAASNIGLCVLRSEKSTAWKADFVPIADWKLPTPLTPGALANAIYDFCLHEHISIVLLDGPQGWKDPESPLLYCRECEKSLNTPAKTGVQGVVKPAPYKAFVEFSIAVFAHLLQEGAELASTPQLTIKRGLLVLESFPNAAWRKLGIDPLPAKARCKPADILGRLKELSDRFEIESPGAPATHDQLQALVAAIAGRAIVRGESGAYLAYGVPPSIKDGVVVEGFIFSPQVRMVRVFQYGSNTLCARLNGPKRLSGRAQPGGLAQTVEDFDIAFDVPSHSNGCAASDLVHSPGRKAWGVIYEIPDGFVFGRRKDHERTLEQIEGLRYEPREITVIDTKGKQSTAWTFVVKDKDKQGGLVTSAAYVSWIVYGLRQHGAPEDYIKHVIEVAKETNRQASKDSAEQNRLIDTL